MNSTKQAAEFGPCRAAWTGDELTIANDHVERKWRVENGLLYPTSYRDLGAARQWCVKPAYIPAPSPPAELVDEPRAVTFRHETGRENPVSAEALIVELTAAGASATLNYRFVIFPEARGVMMQLTVEDARRTAPSGAAAAEPPPEDADGPPSVKRDVLFPQVDLLEFIEPDSKHLRLTQVTFKDQTDHHNELVQESSWLLHPNEGRLELKGNLFVLEDTLSGDGLMFLKHAPLPGQRPSPCRFDLLCSGSAASFWGPRDVPYGPDHPAWPMPYQLAFYGHGMDGQAGDGYAWAMLAYTGGRAGQVAAIQTYQRQLRPYEAGRDGLFLSNTWGDRSGADRINREFVAQEVAAAARLGVDVVQLDHGWEKGTLSQLIANDGAWQGFWAANPEFWEVETTRLPDGLDPLVAEARRLGMQFGLWFAPDSANDFANWQRDAEAVLGLHRQLGINYFKIDGLKLRTRAGERNLRRFFDRVLTESDGRVVFDYDVTAERRSGYFGMMHVGPLFVENRYTDWHRYWPHQTLRNIWKLAHYVDPVRLRMELLNHSRNEALYAGDPLAPREFTPAYMFAVTMFTSPLGWFEVANLPECYFEQIAPLAKVRKAHLDAIFAGAIVPIGEAPDGTAWTGFVSGVSGGRSGYLLIFRELNDRPEWSQRLQTPAGAYRVETLAGEGGAALADGVLTVRIPRAKSFLLARFEAKT